MIKKKIIKILKFNNIAVIGMSRDPLKAANHVPKYLIENGYKIYPVNPLSDEILGQKCYNNVSDINFDIDICVIFRPSDQVLTFIEEIIKISPQPKVIWLQEGIHNYEAQQLCLVNGIEFVSNRCIMIDHLNNEVPLKNMPSIKKRISKKKD